MYSKCQQKIIYKKFIFPIDIKLYLVYYIPIPIKNTRKETVNDMNTMNTIIRIENGKIYAKSYLCEDDDIFEIVEKIPEGFFIWSIGEYMGSDEYIPLCQYLHPEDKDDHHINRNTLKAIKLDIEEVQLLREAAHIGITSKATAEKALKSKRKGYWSNRKRAAAEKTIEIFNKITA